MKSGIIILCRYSSRRLPGKILKPILGKPILQRIYERLRQRLDADRICIATSEDASDDIIEHYCSANNMKCFRGSLNNVALRFLKAAEFAGFDFATRINGDNLFIDLDVLEEMLNIAENDNFDFVTNVEGRTFPFGMSIEILRTDFYKTIYESLNTPDYKEHVTLYLYHHNEIGKRLNFFNEKYPDAKGLKLAIDTPEDFDHAIKILQNLNDDMNYSLGEICQVIEK